MQGFHVHVQGFMHVTLWYSCQQGASFALLPWLRSEIELKMAFN